MAFNMFPYSNLHRLNTDWVLEEIRKAQEAVQDAKEEVDAAVAIMEGYDDRLTALADGLSTLSGTVTTLGSTVSTLGTTVAGQGDLITGLSGTVTSQGHAITALNNSAVKVTAQSWNSTQQGQARDNIGAASASSVSTLGTTVAGQGDLITGLTGTVTSQGNAITALNNSAVKVTAQTLTNAQKLRARQNIGAAAAGDTPGQGSLVANIIYNAQTGYSLDGMTIQEIISALNDEFSPVTIVAVMDGSRDVLAFTNLRSEEFTSGGSTYNLITGYAISNDLIYKLTISSQTEAVTFESQPLRLPVKEVVQGSTATIAATRDHYYSCGTLDSLTVTVSGTSGAWSIAFTSGATPTVTSIPSTILGLESFAAEANTVYEINVLDNRAVVGSWAVTV